VSRRNLAYLRVSTDEQAQSGAGLAAQEAKVLALGEVHDLDELEVVVDAGWSAKTLDRPHNPLYGIIPTAPDRKRER
jgi:site-specific DNA recombinase